MPADGSAPPRRLTSSKGGESGAGLEPGQPAARLHRPSARTTRSRRSTCSTWPGGGEARRVTSSPAGRARRRCGAPTARSIAFQGAVYPGAADAEANAKIAAERKDAKSKVRIYDTFPIRRWDKWLDDTQTHLFVVPADGDGRGRATCSPARGSWPCPGSAAPAAKARARTSQPAWTPDGAVDRVRGHHQPQRRRLRARRTRTSSRCPCAGGEPRALTTGNATLRRARASRPTARRSASASSDEWGKIYALDRVACAAWPWTGAVTPVTAAFDRSVGRLRLRARRPDAVPHRGGLGLREALLGAGARAATSRPSSSRAASSAAIEVPERRAAAVHRRELGHRDRARPRSCASTPSTEEADARSPASTPTRRPPSTGRRSQEFWFTNAQGRRVHSFVALPQGFDPAKKYPLLVLIHGGHANMWRDQITLRWNYHLLASPGYVVLLTDYRGSTGYGEQFTLDILGDPLRGPADDINQAADEAIKRYPFIDAHAAGRGRAPATAATSPTGWRPPPTRYKCLVSHAGLSSLQTQWAHQRRDLPPRADDGRAVLGEARRPGSTRARSPTRRTSRRRCCSRSARTTSACP